MVLFTNEEQQQDLVAAPQCFRLSPAVQHRGLAAEALRFLATEQ